MDWKDPVMADANILLLFSKYSWCDLQCEYFCWRLESKLDVLIDKVGRHQDKVAKWKWDLTAAAGLDHDQSR